MAYAVKAIHRGEEVFRNYDTTWNFLTAARRGVVMRQRYDFVCDGNAYATQDPRALHLSNMRRRIAFELFWSFGGCNSYSTERLQYAMLETLPLPPFLPLREQTWRWCVLAALSPINPSEYRYHVDQLPETMS